MEFQPRDPEAMLARLRTENPQDLRGSPAGRGRLKLFFGYIAGVGKTYTMLESARAAAASGRNVLVGYIETHGRPETEALLVGQDTLPRRKVDYRGVKLFEFDLDEALTRRPEVILVDELAHTNAAGSRHNKRWQDIWELLEAGSDVWTTLNVQHIESLNDIVAQITGIHIHETIPDRIFDEADDVELVDLPPAELLERLREGKVYVPEQAERAAERFFRKANLVALRELAMRRTADRVSHEVQTARLGLGARTQIWPTTERLLVCVSPSPTSARVIRTAKRMASAMHAQWIAVHTETAATTRLDDRTLQRLNQHLKLAEQLGAETVTISGEDVADTVLQYAQSRNVTKIVIGKTGYIPWYNLWRRSIVDRLIAKSGDIDIYVIRGVEEKLGPLPALAKRHVALGGYLTAGGLLAAATAISVGFHELGLAEPNLIMTYLLAVVLTAAWCGRGPAIVSSAISVLLFNFFFTKPYYTFLVDDPGYIYTFLVMLLVALIVSALTIRVRDQVEVARERERRTEAQYRVSRALANTSGGLELAAAAEEQLSTIFGGEIVLFEDGKSLRPIVRRGQGWTESPRELEAASWVLKHRQVAGRGTDTLPMSEAIYIPLQGADMPVGVLGWRPARASDLESGDRRQLLETFATQIALALERDRLAHEAQRILAEAEAERLRSSLLSSVSHDLRTPLAAISGSASALINTQLDEETKKELATNIYDEADRLARLVENLLHLTRIESGSMKVEKEWQPLDEVFGSALRRAESALTSHLVAVSILPDLGLVPIDGLLVEQVLVNLLENGAKYTPAGSEIAISAERMRDEIVVAVADRGPGLAENERERVFDKFYRSDRNGRDRSRGAGLGLAICKAIIQAHGGTIWAEPREAGGTRFVFTLPIDGSPPAIAESAQSEGDCENA